MNDLQLNKKYQFTKHGLLIHDDTSFEEWDAMGHVLFEIETLGPITIGDWLCFGENKYGETYTQAAALTGKDPSTLAHYKWVASSVPLEMRMDGLSFSHYRLVAKEDDETKIKLLTQAKMEGLSSTALKDLIRPPKNEQKGCFFCGKDEGLKKVPICEEHRKKEA